MVILKYELKRHRTYILGWAIALALCIFLMTPTYYSFLDAASVELFETMGTTDFYRSVGVSMEYRYCTICVKTLSFAKVSGRKSCPLG